MDYLFLGDKDNSTCFSSFTCFAKRTFLCAAVRSRTLLHGLETSENILTAHEIIVQSFPPDELPSRWIESIFADVVSRCAFCSVAG